MPDYSKFVFLLTGGIYLFSILMLEVCITSLSFAAERKYLEIGSEFSNVWKISQMAEVVIGTMLWAALQPYDEGWRPYAQLSLIIVIPIVGFMRFTRLDRPDLHRTESRGRAIWYLGQSAAVVSAIAAGVISLNGY